MIQVFDPTNQSAAPLWGWITLCGRDARDFLHRLTTIDVNALEIGHGQPGCFLNAQGKIRASFDLWRYGAEDFAFELEIGPQGGWKKELLATIDQYTFAEKIQLADVSPLGWVWLFADSVEELIASLGSEALQPGMTQAIDEEIRICHHGEADYGRAWISAWGRPARLAQWLERTLPAAVPIDIACVERWRIQAMSPRVDAEITTSTIPLEAGMARALSQGKGCYPGQEVIERIVSQGSPPRRLVRIDGIGGQTAVGEAIFNLAEPPVEIGQITSLQSTGPGSFVALGFARKIHAKEDLQVRVGAAGAHGVIVKVAPYV